MDVSATLQQGGETREHLWLESRLNNQADSRMVLALKGPGELLWLAQDDLATWGVVTKGGQTTLYEHAKYVSLQSLGITFVLDPRASSLVMEAPVDSFVENVFQLDRNVVIQPDPSPLGGFVNYDISATQVEQTTLGGFFEVGMFSQWGSVTSNILARDGGETMPGAIVRLDSTWRQDDPGNARTWRIGDSINRSTDWAGAVRFGGIQWGTNYSTQPQLITMPTMSVEGEAAIPSTVELYVNDALRMREEVKPGPFSVTDIPIITGSGDVRVVVKDMLGREQVITQNYYGTQRLLKEGLADYSLELGAVREGYGIRSNDYGRVFGAATFRKGKSDSFTYELHAQATSDHQAAGAGAAWSVPAGGVLHASLALSHNEDEIGHLVNGGFQKQGQFVNAGILAQFADSQFTRLGNDPLINPLPTRQFQAFLSKSMYRGGSVNLAYTEQVHEAREDVSIVNLSYSTSLAMGFLNVSAIHECESGRNSFELYYMIPIGQERTNASFQMSERGGETSAIAQIQKGLPAGTGAAYRLKADVSQQDLIQGYVAYQNDVGHFDLQVSRNQGQTGYRAGIRGGLALMEREVFASRYIGDAFAVVDVPGVSGVAVYMDNLEVAHTNVDGKALVPRLRPYETNRISIDQSGIPLEFGMITDKQKVVPYYRSGVSVAFDIGRSRDLLFRIIMPDGDYMPTPAFVEIDNGERYPVGDWGAVYMQKFSDFTTITAYWQDSQCVLDIELPDDVDGLVELDDIHCKQSALQ